MELCDENQKHGEDTCPLAYRCRLPLSSRTVYHLADLLRRHLKVIRSRWRILTKLRTNPARATHLLRALLVLTNLEVSR